jgi:hypothetical protein
MPMRKQEQETAEQMDWQQNGLQRCYRPLPDDPEPHRTGRLRHPARIRLLAGISQQHAIHFLFGV